MKTIVGDVRIVPVKVVLLLLLSGLALSGCGAQRLVDRILLTPTDATPGTGQLIPVVTPQPTPTPFPIVARPMAVNLLRESVKPGEDQQIEVTGTPEIFVNIIVTYANGDQRTPGTHLGAQLDLNGTFLDRWTVEEPVPGGTASVLVENVSNGQTITASFTIDAPSWGSPPRQGPAPITGYVPYGTPGAGIVVVTPVPAPRLESLVTPIATATPKNQATVSPNAQLHVMASVSSAIVANGQPVTVVGQLADAAGHGVSGAHMFAIGHLPTGASSVWIANATSDSAGRVAVTGRVTGVKSGSLVTVDVFMTYGGRSYRGTTSFHVR
ncbi:MAG: hypothetical protein M1296_05795 [Chloroflexi bacterium]|nr:hypothetical protein [Chloroflexota bacterium]